MYGWIFGDALGTVKERAEKERGEWVDGRRETRVPVGGFGCSHYARGDTIIVVVRSKSLYLQVSSNKSRVLSGRVFDGT